MFKNVLLIISAIALCHVSPTYAVTDTGQVEVVLRQNPVFSKLHFNDAILFFDTIKTIPNTGRPKYYPPRPLPANIVDLPVRILQNQISSYLTLDDLKSLIQAVNAIEKTLAPLAYARYIIEDQPVPEEIKNVLNRVQQTKDKQVLKDTIARLILLESNNIFKWKKPIPPFLMPYFKSMNSNIKFLVPKYILTGAKRYIKSSGNYWIDINSSNKAINALIKKNITAEMDGYISFNQAIKRKNEGLDVPKRIVATAREIRRKENFPKLHILFNGHPEYELVVDFENAEKTTSLESRHLPPSVKKIVIVGKKLTTIGKYFCHYCKYLTSILLPDSLIKIDSNFCSHCENLESIFIPSKVTYIGSYFFFGPKTIKSIILPNNLKYIGCFFLFGGNNEIILITVSKKLQDVVKNLDARLFRFNFT